MAFALNQQFLSPVPNAAFGFSSKITKDSNYLIVAAPLQNQGVVYVYKKNISFIWEEIFTIQSSRDDIDHFGFNVAISNQADYIAISAFLINNSNGIILLFKKDKSVNGLIWEQIQAFQQNNINTSIGIPLDFGKNATYLVSGNPARSLIIVYYRKNWSNPTIITQTDTNFGQSLAIDGSQEYIIVGANKKVFVYKRTQINQWKNIFVINNPINKFSRSVSLTTNANFILVGASNMAIYFGKTNTNEWELVERLTGTPESIDFGATVVINDPGSFTAISDPLFNNGQGQVYASKFFADPTLINPPSGDYLNFGSSISLSNQEDFLVGNSKISIFELDNRGRAILYFNIVPDPIPIPSVQYLTNAQLGGIIIGTIVCSFVLFALVLAISLKNRNNFAKYLIKN